MQGKPSPTPQKTEQKPSGAVEKSDKNRKARAAKTACIWEDTRWRGDVRIGDYTIIGPGCCLQSFNGGAINIGSQNVLTEGVQIINRSEEPMEIGHCNIFETGAKVEARKIGSYNLFGSQSYVMSGCRIGSGCVIGPQMQVINKRIPDSTIMAAANLYQIQKTFKQRNSMYVQSLVKLLTRKFKEKEETRLKNAKRSKLMNAQKSQHKDGKKYGSQNAPRSDGRQRYGAPRADGGRQTISGSSRYNNSKDNTRLAPRARGERRRTAGDQARQVGFVPRTDKKSDKK